MAKFIIRIELYDGNSEDYDILHDAMEEKNMLKRIQDEQTLIWYELPPAQYYYKGPIEDREIILDQAVQCINMTGLEFGIIVTTANGSSWDGLSKYFF